MSVRTSAAALLLLAAAAGCRDAPTSSGSGDTARPSAGVASEVTGTATPDPRRTVAPPGPLRDDLLPADLLVHASRSFSAAEVRAIHRLPGVTHVEPLALGQVPVGTAVLDVAAVDPASYRRLTQPGSAQLLPVWQRVAGGEAAVDPQLDERLLDDGHLTLGNEADAPRVHVGAWATQVPRIDAVVNPAWGEVLGIAPRNALVVSVDRVVAPRRVRPGIVRVVGDEASVQLLGPDLDVTALQTAVLTGGSVAEAVGGFTYRLLGGGRIAPAPEWVARNIRTAEVPILGQVRCHRVLLPQLRAALAEVVASGLADEVHADEYAGCYHPRFIAGTDQLSLHSFGIAVDLNVPGNLRGTEGAIDRRVVAVFEKWGFAWGGHWSWTDPMHFELDRLVEVR